MESELYKAFRNLQDEVIKNRREIKSAIEASEARLLMKVEEQKQKANQLEKENIFLKNKVEILERNLKKNNIIIFGLENQDTSSLAITEKLSTLLGVVVRESDLNNSYPVGKTEKPPVKVEFISYLKKLDILKQCRKLKGTGITISHDLTLEQRREHKILKHYLNKSRENPTHRSFIKGNKLYVNDTVYTVNELEEINNSEEQKASSAPATPNLRNLAKEFELQEETYVNVSPKSTEEQENKKTEQNKTPKTTENKKIPKQIVGGPAPRERTRSQRSNK